jgi:Ca2+-binding RTX toxin-like protein
MANYYGNSSPNVIYGSNGNDRILGRGGNDTLYGEGGNDVVNGEAGDDDLYGGAGKDTLRGSFGNDELWGGSGNDKFGFITSFNSTDQTDWIWDFHNGDKIQLGNYRTQIFDHLDDNNDGALDISDNNVTDFGTHLELNLGAYFGKSIYLNVADVDEMNFSDFIV